MHGTKSFLSLFMHHGAISLLLNAPFCLSCMPSKDWHSCYMMEYRLVSVLLSAIISNVPRQCLITESDFLMTLLKFIWVFHTADHTYRGKDDGTSQTLPSAQTANSQSLFILYETQSLSGAPL